MLSKYIAALMAGLSAVSAAGQTSRPAANLRPVSFRHVEIRDTFWAPRIEVNRTRTLPHCLDQCEKTGRISNFAKAAGQMPGKYEGAYFNDSDVYKILEGAAYCLTLHADPELEARVDKVIDWIAAAQQPDGYLNAYYTLMEPENRWTNLFKMHELYCAGHLFEAAVAMAEGTGKTKLLDVARRFADHIDATFGPGRKFGYSGHPEIELALLRLYRHTGEERYLRLARWFLEVRGTAPIPKQNADPSTIQAHMPIRQQREIMGHAVRAMYLYAGVTDLVRLGGDAGYDETLHSIWDSVALRKMYVTGGVGAEHQHEAFGSEYHLPNDSAYAETCAALALVFWNQRMALLTGDAKYADVVERALYNGALSGVSLDGVRFFYTNPLASVGKHHRQPWFGCACCPSNVVRVIPSIGEYLYSTADNAVYVSQYVGSRARIAVAGIEATLTMDTDYPWSGDVKIRFELPKPTTFRMCLRIPEWAGRADIAINGESLHRLKIDHGYLEVRWPWKTGDVLSLAFPMEVRRIEAHPKVVANRGRVALQRGPVVYCLEALDNGGKVLDLSLPRQAELSAEHRPDFLGGVTVIKGRAQRAGAADWAGKLYQPARPTDPVEITAVPYCVWDNRDPGEMVVWLPEAPGLAGQ